MKLIAWAFCSIFVVFWNQCYTCIVKCFGSLHSFSVICSIRKSDITALSIAFHPPSPSIFIIYITSTFLGFVIFTFYWLFHSFLSLLFHSLTGGLKFSVNILRKSLCEKILLFKLLFFMLNILLIFLFLCVNENLSEYIILNLHFLSFST